MDTSKTITHLSLCSGYEGIGLGLRRVLPNLREIAYVEIEAFAIANLVAKMEAEQLDPAPIFTDLKTFPYEQFRGKVDILSGGFPCQPFSAAGQRKATDDPRHLFPFIADGIKECQPRIFFLENVQGILSCTTSDGEPVLKYVLRTLEEMGYRATAGIFSASEVGAPHQRKRVFILGYAQHNGYASTKKPRGTSESQEEGRVQELERGSNATPELADSERSRSCGGWRSEECGDDQKWIQSNEGKRNKLRSKVKGRSNSSRWPSRPSQAQYGWEEPRVTQAEPQLGGAINGTSCRVDATTNRVDRLRLLGNGVVNQTAAKAFVTLINKIFND